LTLSTGSYHVLVSGYSVSAGDYTLAYSAGVANCDEPPPPSLIACNDRDAVAGAPISPTLAEVGVVSGSVTSSSSASHAFEVCEAGTFLFSFCDAAATASYDPWLCVLDDTGVLLASNDDTCSLLSEVSVTLFAGSYHVVVSGYSTSAGDYTLAYSADVNNCQGPPPEPAPTADFMVSEIGGEAPVDVSFIDMSTGAIDSWAWDFGDGGTSSSQNPTHTYTTEGSYTVTLTVTGPGGSDSASCFDCILVTPPPPPPPEEAKIYVSFKGTASIPGVGTVRDEDIVSYDPAVDEWAMFFDGSDVGLGGTDIDAFSIRADGSIVLSFNSGSFSVPGLVGGPSGTTVDDSDLLEFAPVSTGATTEGVFTFLLDGSDIGLTTNGEDIDGVCWLEDGTILFSTQGTARGDGPTARDEDIVSFFPTTLGSETEGAWTTFFDGSDVGYSQSSQEDVDGFSMTEDQSVLLSTVGMALLDGASGDDEDLFLFSGSFGSSTSGSTTLALALSSVGIDISEDVDGVSIR